MIELQPVDGANSVTKRMGKQSMNLWQTIQQMWRNGTSFRRFLRIATWTISILVNLWFVLALMEIPLFRLLPARIYFMLEPVLRYRYYITQLLPDDMSPILIFFVVWPVSLLLLNVLAGAYWGYLVNSTMAPPILLADTDSLQRGQTLDMRYSQLFRRNMTIEQVKLSLVQHEWVKYTSGTDTYTKTEELVLDEVEMDNISATANMDVGRKFTLRVPDNAMHTFEQSHNKITYFVRLTVDVPGWADFGERYRVRVSSAVDDGGFY